MDFLKEQNGKDSIIRAGFLMCVITGCLIGLGALIVSKGKDLDYVGLTSLVSVYLAIPFMGKAYQRGRE